jgi:hypothetical protein
MMSAAGMKRFLLPAPRTPSQLHGFVLATMGFNVPRQPLIPGHQSPFDYLCHTFFEESLRPPIGRSGHGGDSKLAQRLNPPQPALSQGERVQTPRDCIVWANRGGGKTQLGAIATLLDMVFKPGIQVRILAGSFEQSSKMYRALRDLLSRPPFEGLVDGHVTGRFVAFRNGSRVEVLSQSERSVRGHRVHKLRCDEIEEFTDDVWRAAQMVTRSGWCGDVFVRGAIEALSTMHRPFGLMQQLIDEARGGSRVLFHWSVLDVLERCPPARDCATCPLWDDCRGMAKAARGFLHIDDAIMQKSRVSDDAWKSEMLCSRPSVSHRVYPEFEPAVHVQPFSLKTVAGGTDEPPRLARVDSAPQISHGRCEAHRPWHPSLRGVWLGGIDFGYRAPTVFLWAWHDHAHDALYIVDEQVASERTASAHIERALSRMREAAYGRPAWVGADPAGHQRNEHTGRSTISLWREAGFMVRTKAHAIEQGVAALRARLRRADGTIGLIIHPRCEKLIDAMLRYHYPPDRERDDQPVKDGPDHACDALRYLVFNLDGRSGDVVVREY